MIDIPSNWDKDETYRSEGYLSIANVPHLFDDEEKFARIKGLTEIQLSEEDNNWTWKDVASISPMSDAWDNKPILRPRSSIHRHEYMISSSADKVYQALCHAVGQFEMMRSIAVVKSPREESHTLSNGVPFANTWFAILKQNTSHLSQKLITTIEVHSIERDINTAFQDDYHDGTRVQPPGWLVHFTIVKSSKEPKRCGLLYQVHHAIFDMTSISLFLDVVEDHLNGNTVRKSIPSYGPYAFWRYTLPYSSQGRENVDFNAKLLSGIAQTAGKAAMWPPKRAKGWMRGNDNGCDRSERTPLGPTGSKQRGLYDDNFAINVKGIYQLRTEHGLSPAKVVKGAQILFNVWKTGSSEAVFVGAEGGRMVKGVIPSSIDMLRVPGQVAEGSITRFSVPSRDEKVIDFLRRVQEDQILLSKYNPCHRGHVVAALSKEDQDYLIELGPRQVFNWAPKVPNSRTKIVLKKFEGRSDIGLSWVFRMSTKEDEEDILIVEASWDNCQMTFDEVELSTKELLSAAKWLANPANINKPISDCVFAPSIAYDYTS